MQSLPLLFISVLECAAAPAARGMQAVEDPPSAPTRDKDAVQTASPELEAPASKTTHTYAFVSPDELSDFTILLGSWSINDGCLLCSSKGLDDEIQWRRELGVATRMTLETTSQGRCGILLRGSDGQLLVSWLRSRGEFVVEKDRAVLKAGTFDKVKKDVMVVSLEWTPPELRLQFGDDEPSTLTVADPVPHCTRLSILSSRAQAKIQKLTFERTGKPGGGGTAIPEEEKLAIERAEGLGAAGDWEAALKEIDRLVPRQVAPARWRETLSPKVLELLTRVALNLPRHRGRSPIAELMEQTLLVSDDGTLAAYLPFRNGWHGEAHRLRRVDGVQIDMNCSAPPLTVELYRYDQRHQYWFGAEPRLQYVGGSSSPAINAARFKDQVAEHKDAVVVHEPREVDRVGGKSASAYEITYEVRPKGQPVRKETRRELTFVHRGNTIQLAFVGAPDAIAAAELEITWILRSLELRNN